MFIPLTTEQNGPKRYKKQCSAPHIWMVCQTKIVGYELMRKRFENDARS